MNKSLAILFASAVAVLGWAPTIAHAAPPPTSQESSAKRVALQVNVDDIPESERGVAPFVLEQVAALIKGGGHGLTDEPGPGVIVLQVRLRAMEIGNRNYGLHFEFVNGDRVAPAVQWAECIFCTEANLLARLEDVGPELLTALAQHKTGVDVDSASDPAANDDSKSRPAKVALLGPLGGVGIGIAALGLGGVVWGAVDLARGRVFDEPAEPGRPSRRTWADYGPRGAVVLGVGVGGIVLGGAMLVADLVIRSKKRAGAKRPIGSVAPIVSPQIVGLGWAQRF